MFFGLVLILAIVGIGFFAYKGIKEYGDFKSYATSLIVKKVSEKVNLTNEQVSQIESGNYEAIVEDFQENITPEQINCAVSVVGEERAAELVEKQNPTPTEIFKLTKCY